MQQALFSQGVELMLAGIGSVFVFLVLLVVATRVMSWALMRFVNTSAITSVNESANVNDPADVAAIAAAVSRYRKEQSQ